MLRGWFLLTRRPWEPPSAGSTSPQFSDPQNLPGPCLRRHRERRAGGRQRPSISKGMPLHPILDLAIGDLPGNRDRRIGSAGLAGAHREVATPICQFCSPAASDCGNVGGGSDEVCQAAMLGRPRSSRTSDSM